MAFASEHPFQTLHEIVKAARANLEPGAWDYLAGAAAAAQAAAEFGVPMMLSCACHPGLEATAAAAESLRIFQL